MPFPFSTPTKILAGLFLIAISVGAAKAQDDGGASLTVSVPIITSGSNAASTITKTGSGTLVLSGSNTYSGGGTVVSSGTLTLNGTNNSSGATLTSSNTSSGTLTLSGTNTSTGGTLSTGSGTGGGTLTLGGTGTITVGGGTITGGGTLSGGNNLGFSPTATFSITLPNSFVPNPVNSISLAGTLHLTVAAGSLSQLNASSTYTLLSSTTSITGQFANIASGDRLSTTDGSGSFLVTYSGTSLIVSDFQPTDILGGVYIGSGWETSPWFGTYNGTYYPWIYHSQLGFIYLDTSDPNNIYFDPTDKGLGWCYTTAQTFPNIYNFSQSAWFYYAVGTTSFYNFSTGKWTTY